MPIDMKSRIDEPRAMSTIFKMYLLKTAFILAATGCGFWVAGSRNILYWTYEMSGWINGDNGPDVVHIAYETVKLSARVTIAGYGSYGLLRAFTSSWG